MYRNEKGISLLALIIIVIIMIVLAIVIWGVVRDIVHDAMVEDIRANMLAIQGMATNSAQLHEIGELEYLPGTAVDLDYLPEAIRSRLQYVMVRVEVEGYEPYYVQQFNFRIFRYAELSEVGLSISTDRDGEFYIVDFNNMCEDGKPEVLYSLGVNGQYTLTELQEYVGEVDIVLPEEDEPEYVEGEYGVYVEE
ncbi:MAG: hypothetical protein FWC79_04330 [Oscillospiraceae bacterium]|nr:hypothetical protein [Oscillospiraceae bacterium]